MTDRKKPLIFDGHNDVLSRLYDYGSRDAARLFTTGRDGHLDLSKAKTGGFGGGFFAIYIPSSNDLADTFSMMENPPYDLPLPNPVAHKDALQIANHQAALLFEMQRHGALKICTRTDQIRDCLEVGTIAAVMHMEGAEAIDEDLYALDVFHRAGLRSLGPVWSRETIFGHGVPFRYPSTGNIGPGLTDAGIRLVKACDERGIMLDVSHLNEAGFWDIEKHSANPIVATHSNAYTICPHARNLTDKQLDAIRESKGMVGLNFAVAFTRPDGAMDTNTPIESLLIHLDYLIERLGEDHVGLGSDFDGAHIPDAIKDVRDLPLLRNAMKGHGYNDELMTKLCHENWICLLARIWE